jgi:hypothetical protein
MSPDADVEYLDKATQEGQLEISCYLAIHALITFYGGDCCREFITIALDELDPPCRALSIPNF